MVQTCRLTALASSFHVLQPIKGLAGSSISGTKLNLKPARLGVKPNSYRAGAVVAKYGDKSVYFDLEDLGNTTGQWDVYGSDAPSPYNSLQIDLLAEISQSPHFLSEVDAALKAKQMKTGLDEYLKTRPQGTSFLSDLKQKLLLSPSEAARAGTRYNVPLMNSLVLYVGMQAIQQLQARTPHGQSMASNASLAIFLAGAALDIFQTLIFELERLRLLEVNTASVSITNVSYKLVLLVHIVSTAYIGIFLVSYIFLMLEYYIM